MARADAVTKNIWIAAGDGDLERVKVCMEPAFWIRVYRTFVGACRATRYVPMPCGISHFNLSIVGISPNDPDDVIGYTPMYDPTHSVDLFD